MPECFAKRAPALCADRANRASRVPSAIPGKVWAVLGAPVVTAEGAGGAEKNRARFKAAAFFAYSAVNFHR
jgi:hypothetical protein